MLHCGNCMPVPFVHSTVGCCVTFPAFPYQNAKLTQFSQHQTSVCSYSGKASETTCEKCRSKKVESLNRQLYELVKKHGLVEVAGKEILGWFMLLADEDRRLIREYGHISEYIKKNPSLLVVNNWVQLKSESAEIPDNSSESYCSSMENSQSLEDNYSSGYSEEYCDKMLLSSRHGNINPRSNTLWYERDNDFKKDLDPGTKSLNACDAKSLHLEMWDSATLQEPIKTFDTEQIKDPLTPVLPLNFPNNQKTGQEFAYVTSCLQTTKPLAKEQHFSDCQAVYKESSEYDLSCHASLKTGKNFEERDSFSRGYESFEDSNRVVAQDQRSPLPWRKCISDGADHVDNDCSSVDIPDDETFFSVKSGSFYSRSSSPFSLDDNTDVEQCVFEEALEDFSGFSKYIQSHNSPIEHEHWEQSPVWDPFLEIKHMTRTTNEQKGSVEKTTVCSKTKQRDALCNTDLSLVSVSYDQKETQTPIKSTQDTGVNTEPIESVLFSQIQDAAPGVGIAKTVQESEGTKGYSSPEALLQRAVKAELQLVDIQRWLCWQMCWKTQQESIEKQSFFNLNKEPTTQSGPLTSFSLSSALAEVEEKYQEMRAKIQSGTPLDTLVPLNMQLTTVGTSTDHPLNDPIQHSGKDNVSNVPAEGSKETKCMKNDFEPSFKSCLDKFNHTSNATGFVQRLAEWAVSDQGTRARARPHRVEHTQMIDPTESVSDPNRFYVHVGNIAPCVKEVEVMEVFRKFHVLSVFLEESSLTCSYAVLIFCKSEEAEAAIKEMDGRMLHGKKLKVRAIKTSNYNLPLAFQKIKCDSKDLTEDEKGRFPAVQPKEGFQTMPPKSDSTQPAQDQHGPTPATSLGGSAKNLFGNMSSSKCFPHINTNQGFPAAPPYSVSGFSNLIGPGYQWMWQSQHSNMLSYSNMPNLMYVPFSYPFYKWPNHSPSQSLHPSNSAPSTNIKFNVNTQFPKEDSISAHAKPVKSTQSTNRQSKLGIPRFNAHKQVSPSVAKAKVLENNIGSELNENKQVTVKYVNEQTSLTRASNANLHCSEPASQGDSCKMSFPVTKASVPGVGTTVTDCPSSGYTPKNIYEPLDPKSAAPLRFPTFVPPSVTIPEAGKLYVNPTSSTGITTQSPKQAEISSSATSPEGGSQSTGNLTSVMKQQSPIGGLEAPSQVPCKPRVPCKPQDWGVYPKLDPSSELPIVIIPNQLNFSQFKRVVKYLMDYHQDCTREQIIATLEEIRRKRGGTFGGWTIPDIIYAVSSKLLENIPPA
ncbi:RNA-binding protein 44 isoform X2 [Dendropsophus ebraccatus]|uniref:RNA-binding protein 44 isoform X2 n=1 Tax=Dendropsophus ebraccatus TaxID=150705 RepID=UPI00383163FB